MSTRGPEDDEAGTAAAYWLLMLEEQPDDAELRARFEAWLAASPANQAAWAGTSDVYDLIGSPGYVAHRAARAEQRAGIVPRSRRRPLNRRVALAFVATALAACIVLFALPGVILRLQADHVTAIAETRSLSLEDGSQVALAPDSAIHILPGRGRTIRLLKGQALFQVTRNPDSPFRVLANDVETTVLGTEFDVRLQEGGAVVAVREGMVRVDMKGAAASEQLAAGDWLSVAAPRQRQRGKVPTTEIAVWQAGRIVARDRSIADVVDEIGRSFPGVIVMPTDAFGQQRVTGVYNLADPVMALRAVAGVYGGVVRQVSPWLLIVTAS